MAHDIITNLRDLAPQRRLSADDALHLAEQQARLILRRSSAAEPPVSIDVLQELPRIQVGYGPTSPSAAAAQWSGGRWLILLNERDSRARQRWSLAHEVKHILDHPFEKLLYPGRLGHDLAERSCDYFAACLLMPAPWLRRCWASGERDASVLAKRFGVPRRAIRIRLLQIGLVDATSHYIAKEV